MREDQERKISQSVCPVTLNTPDDDKLVLPATPSRPDGPQTGRDLPHLLVLITTDLLLSHYQLRQAKKWQVELTSQLEKVKLERKGIFMEMKR